ncbi:MAG: SMI1/KNR4 family protein [Pirellulales bacterium]
MSTTWSQRVSQRYQVQLPRDLAAWLDEARWQLPGGGEFNHPLSPEQLLEPEPGLIWPGFMLPDTLPLLGNDYGDWLCLRVGADNGVREWLYWSHAGGDWIPSGDTLAESLLYDALRAGEGERHPGAGPTAIFPGGAHHPAPQPAVGWQTHVAWCAAQLSFPATRLQALSSAVDQSWRDGLRAAGLARWALARETLLQQLHCGLRGRSDYRVAQQLGVAWEPDFVMWMFDTQLIPQERRGQLLKHFGTDAESLLRQDWEGAEQAALEVLGARSDLGWAHDIAGWAAERRGAVEVAIERYLVGLRPSLFADHTVPFRTHWVADGFGKFAAARLFEWRAQVPAEAARDPYLQQYWWHDPQTLRDRISGFWHERARQAERSGQFAAAYDLYYQAGWDLGLDQLTAYAPILEGLERTAEAAGMPARARLAALHRGQLRVV